LKPSGKIAEYIDVERAHRDPTSRALYLKAGQAVRVPVDWRRFAVGSDGDGPARGLEKEP
jgi:hypothetical protein